MQRSFDDGSRGDVLAELGKRCAQVVGTSAGPREPGRISIGGLEVRARARRASFTPVRIVGAIPAGRGEEVEPVELGSLPVDLQALDIKRSARVFALRVRGDSMQGANIVDGDLVIIDPREPRVGDIVAALIDGETTLKRFVSENGRVYLKAENPKYPDLIPVRELVVQGVVRAVVRVCDRP